MCISLLTAKSLTSRETGDEWPSSIRRIGLSAGKEGMNRFRNQLMYFTSGSYLNGLKK